MAVATGHKNWISFDMQIVIARYSRFISWRYKYSSSLLMDIQLDDALSIAKVKKKLLIVIMSIYIVMVNIHSDSMVS